MKARTAAILLAALSAVGVVAPVTTVHASVPPGPFVELLFSRTEVSAADGCQPDNRNVAGLIDTVAPWLQSHGIPWSGTLDTTRMGACTHYGDSLESTVSDDQALKSTGAKFGPHVYLSASKLASLTLAQQQKVTCGQAKTIAGWGLPESGLIAYPGAQAPPSALQEVAATCIDWGRRYNHGVGITDSSAAVTAPYWLKTEAANGGPCTTCSVTPLHGSAKYVTPDSVIAQIRSLQPGQVLTIQAYILVTGTNPGYTTSQIKWDCTNPDANFHWVNDNERFCYEDWQRMVLAAENTPGVTFTTPHQLAQAWGRTPSG